MIVATLAILLHLHGVSSTLTHSDMVKEYNTLKRQLHQDFPRSSVDEKDHFHAFKKTAEFIEDHNAQGGSSWKAGYNFLSLMTDEEKKQHGGLINVSSSDHMIDRLSKRRTKLNLTKRTTNPTTVDHTDNLPAVKNQGTCQSCYAFAATAVLEYHVNRHLTGTVVDLSEQQYIDCLYERTQYGGCDGGSTFGCWDYTEHMGSTHSSSADYPYTGEDGTCDYNVENAISGFTVRSYDWVMWNDDDAVDNLENAIADPSIGVLYSGTTIYESFWSYSSGVYTENTGDASVSHAMAIVGYGIESGLGYFKVRNSWSAGWGDNGYIKYGREFFKNHFSDPLFPAVTYSNGDDEEWTSVTRDVYIECDVWTQALQIKTNSAIGSGEAVGISLYDADESYINSIHIKFTDPAQYYLGDCENEPKWNTFPLDLPESQEKIWTITISFPTVRIECNGEEVLTYRTYWMATKNRLCFRYYYNVKKMMFSSVDDTASYEYRQTPAVVSYECSDIPVIEHGVATHASTGVVDDTIKYEEVYDISCNEGFTLAGIPKMVCHEPSYNSPNGYFYSPWTDGPYGRLEMETPSCKAAWQPSKQNTEYPCDLEETSLQIRTSSNLGSKEQIFVLFFNSIAASDDTAAVVGIIIVYFGDPPYYYIGYCTPKWVQFTMPDSCTNVETIWTITKGLTTISIECENEKIVTYKYSDSSTCTSKWSDGDIEMITFGNSDNFGSGYSDTASSEWRVTGPKIKTACMRPSITNGIVTPTDTTVQFGESYEVACQDGVTVHSTMTCCAGGTFDHTPTCQVWLESGTREQKILYDLEGNGLQIKSDSVPGSGDKITVALANTYSYADPNEDLVGIFQIIYKTSTEYMLYLSWCMSARLEFTMPEGNADGSGIWTIIKTTTSISFRYSGEEVVNYEYSSSSMSECATKWSGNVVMMLFHSSDTASDWYRAATTCDKPTIPNGAVSPTDPTVYFGEAYQVTCDSGFAMSGSNTMTCGADRTFDQAPMCQAVQQYECYHHSDEDRSWQTANGASGRELCERHDGYVFSEGDEALAPGCGVICWCCSPVSVAVLSSQCWWEESDNTKLGGKLSDIKYTIDEGKSECLANNRCLGISCNKDSNKCMLNSRTTTRDKTSYKAYIPNGCK